MATASQEKKKNLLPPEEKFWERYSPNHEFPLAGVTSLFLHGLVIGIMVLAAIWYLFQRESESRKPPSMDVVQSTGDGDGFEGKGGEPGLPGEANPPNENVPNPMTTVPETLPEQNANLKDAPNVEFNIPEVGHPEATKDVDKMLENLAKDAADQAKRENKPSTNPKKFTQSGTGNPNGMGGLGGTGGGLGRGKIGTGIGVGGPGGRPATKAEIYAWRWRFDLTGQGKEHANKLAAFGVTLAIPTPDGKFVFIQDLRRRPVDLQPGNIERFKDAVKWKNSDLGSLRELAQELHLPFVPSMVIMLLPRDREEKMAAEELRFALSQRRAPQQIQATWFDFRLRNGIYEPVAIRQE